MPPLLVLPAHAAPVPLLSLQDGTVHLIYGILEKPVHSLQAINISALHRGLQRVQLLKPNISIPQLPSNVETMEITAPDVVIPSQETTYWCYMAELPDGFLKHHIIKVRGKQKRAAGSFSPSARSTSSLPFHREACRPTHHPQDTCQGHPSSQWHPDASYRTLTPEVSQQAADFPPSTSSEVPGQAESSSFAELNPQQKAELWPSKAELRGRMMAHSEPRGAWGTEEELVESRAG